MLRAPGSSNGINGTAMTPHTRLPKVTDFFGGQLEVASLLLEAEKRKLRVLQTELSRRQASSSVRKRDLDNLERSIRRIKLQQETVEREYEQVALGVMKIAKFQTKNSRSQPALGLKQTPKNRGTIFGTITSDESPPLNGTRKTISPQMTEAKQLDVSDSGSGDSGTALDTLLPAEDTNTLIFQNGNLVCGSVEALIQHLVPTATYYPDRSYVFALLLSSRLFVEPSQLLSEVYQLCVFQQNLTAPNVTREHLGDFGPNMIQLLSEWTEQFPYDFRDERMMRLLKELTQRIGSIYPELRADVGALMHALIAKLAGLQRYEDLLMQLDAEAARKQATLLPTADLISVSGESALDVAQQLTHIELERLANIGAEEFVQAFSVESSVNGDRKKGDGLPTRNLEAYVQWFNRLSYLVATETCMHLKKKQRVRSIEFFMDVAKECFNIGNFNSLMAIISGLNLSAVKRLKKTWSKVDSEKLDVLEHQMAPSNNFSSYRSTMKAALWRYEGASNDTERIIVPFFSLLVKDMYFLNAACATRLPNGHINFEKFWQFAKQMMELLAWKQVQCPFERKPTILNYVLTSPVFSDNDLTLASFECQPPESSSERERCKSLKVNNNNTLERPKSSKLSTSSQQS